MIQALSRIEKKYCSQNADGGISSTVGIVLEGTVVKNVMPGGPASIRRVDGQKIEAGDVILQVEDTPVTSQNIKQTLQGSDLPGTTVRVRVFKASTNKETEFALIRSDRRTALLVEELHQILNDVQRCSSVKGVASYLEDIHRLIQDVVSEQSLTIANLRAHVLELQDLACLSSAQSFSNPELPLTSHQFDAKVKPLEVRLQELESKNSRSDNLRTQANEQQHPMHSSLEMESSCSHVQADERFMQEKQSALEYDLRSTLGNTDYQIKALKTEAAYMRKTLDSLREERKQARETISKQYAELQMLKAEKAKELSAEHLPSEAEVMRNIANQRLLHVQNQMRLRSSELEVLNGQIDEKTRHLKELYRAQDAMPKMIPPFQLFNTGTHDIGTVFGALSVCVLGRILVINSRFDEEFRVTAVVVTSILLVLFFILFCAKLLYISLRWARGRPVQVCSLLEQAPLLSATTSNPVRRQYPQYQEAMSVSRTRDATSSIMIAQDANLKDATGQTPRSHGSADAISIDQRVKVHADLSSMADSGIAIDNRKRALPGGVGKADVEDGLLSHKTDDRQVLLLGAARPASVQREERLTALKNTLRTNKIGPNSSV